MWRESTDLLRRPADSVFQPLSRKPDLDLLLAELGLRRQAHDLRHRRIREPTTQNQSVTDVFPQAELLNEQRTQPSDYTPMSQQYNIRGFSIYLCSQETPDEIQGASFPVYIISFPQSNLKLIHMKLYIHNTGM